MARPLRIEFPGGLYHVTSRGDRREDIYLNDADRKRWLELLGEVCSRHNWLCHAYCLMDNHFHIVIETVDGNLSAGMRQLNGVYTQWHNRTHGRVGHVFQGRFKAIIVQRESYLLELARYVVLNPVRAGICAMPEHWPWSSYPAMVGQAHRPNWLHTEWLLTQFGNHYAQAVSAYVDHVRAGVGLPSVWDALQDALYLGDAEFADKSRQTLSNRLLNDSEIPRLQRRARVPPLEVFAAMPDRNSAILKAYASGRYSQKEIASAFDVHYATVSRIVKVKPCLPTTPHD
jgi:REP element-mobilizing transposase RayT